MQDQAVRQQLRRSLKRWYLVTFVAIFIVGTIVGWLYSFALLPVAYIWYYLEIYRPVSYLPLSNTKLTLRESYRNFADSSNPALLWLGEVCALLFLSASLFVFVNSRELWFLGLLGILFGAGGSIAYAYMLMTKQK